jgi:NAD(P)-dependent dehydrogenase (short-subunit alcohol dehydrogenase family)
MENAESRTVVITGGASGIGLATARKAAAAGWRPYLIDLSQESLDAACSELGHAGARGIACDVTNEGAVENAIREATEDHDLKAVVNSAGIGMDKPAVETEVSEFRRILDINLIGSFVVARAAARHWLAHATAARSSTSLPYQGYAATRAGSPMARQREG